MLKLRSSSFKTRNDLLSDKEESRDKEDDVDPNIFSPIKSVRSTDDTETRQTDSNHYINTTASQSVNSYDLWLDTMHHNGNKYFQDEPCTLKSVVTNDKERFDTLDKLINLEENPSDVSISNHIGN